MAMTLTELRLRRAIIGLAALALANCQTMPTWPVLSAGGQSAMSADHNSIRGQLAIAAAPLRSPPTYQPVQGCTYRVVTRDQNDAPFEVRQNTSVRRVRDRLLITVAIGNRTSTALIGPTGQLFDFNVAQGDGTRSTRETFGRVQGEKTDGPAINRVTLAFPHYHRTSLQPGQHVAFVIHESGWPWGYYVYRGTTTYNGVEAIVLDLTTPTMTGRQGEWLTVGFSIIDLRNGLPLLYAVDGGLGYRVERLGCR